MNHHLPIGCGLVALAALTAPSLGQIDSVTGPVDVITPPASVQLGDLESDTQIRAFEEMSQVLLPASLMVNGTPAGQSVSGSVPAGTTVNSFFIHVDPAQSGMNTITTATVTFDDPILGLIYQSADLDATDGLLGAAGTSYPNGFGNRGAQGVDDVFMVNPGDTRQLIITQIETGAGNMDTLRVVTAVPEPGTACVMTAFCTVAAMRRRRR